MTSQQKSILKWLALANVLLLCCLLPILLFVTMQPPGSDPLKAAIDTAQGFAPPTRTRVPTATPTRVLSPTPTPTLEPGWKLHPMAAEKFAVAMPSSWDSSAISKDRLAADMDNLAKKNPAIANSLKSQPAEYLNSLKFIGMETDRAATASGFTPNINIIHTVESVDLTLDMMVAASQKEFADAKIDAQYRRLKIPAGETAEFKFSMPMKLNTNQIVLMAVQYVIVQGRNQYAISCTATDKQAKKYTPICEKIGQSFRWIN